MNKIFDMHCHIVPGVDDGAGSMEESLAILQKEYDDGVRAILLTPHFRREMFETSREVCRERFEALQQQSRKMFPDLGLFLGCEFHVNQDMCRTLLTDPAYRMFGGDYVLTEFSGYHQKNDVKAYINRLLVDGWKPIIAHIERYPSCKDVHFAEELKDMGARVQVNANALLGLDGLGMKMFSRKLLAAGLVDFIGSDAHNTTDRAPHMKRCAEYAEKKLGAEKAQKIMWDNPMAIIRAGATAISQ